MIIEYIERLFEKVVIKIKILYWKLKYGNRIKIGKRLSFRKRFKILIKGNGKLKIGDDCFFNNDCSINCLEGITIGNDNIFGENVRIYDHNHKFSKNILDKDEYNKNQIIIGENNWFGTNVVILSKTNIGNYNVIGAGTVLNLEIKNNKIVTNKSRELEIKDIKEKI